MERKSIFVDECKNIIESMVDNIDGMSNSDFNDLIAEVMESKFLIYEKKVVVVEFLKKYRDTL